jgi:hypothetical protein
MDFGHLREVVRVLFFFLMRMDEGPLGWMGGIVTRDGMGRMKGGFLRKAVWGIPKRIRF